MRIQTGSYSAILIWSILFNVIGNQIAFSESWPFSASIPKQLMTTYMEFQHYPDSADPDPYLHDGLDIMAPAQSKVQSIQNGVVRYAYFMGKNYALCWKKAVKKRHVHVIIFDE